MSSKKPQPVPEEQPIAEKSPPPPPTRVDGGWYGPSGETPPPPPKIDGVRGQAQAMLPDDPNRQRAAIKDVETAVRHGWDIRPELAVALQERIRQLIVGEDADGKPTGKTPGPRSLKNLGALAVAMDRLAMDRDKRGRVDAAVTVPITAAELRAMSDDELAAFRHNLDRLSEGR